MTETTVLAAVAERTTPQTYGPMWDYSVITIHARHTCTLEEALNNKGHEGWELVFMTSPLPNEYQCVFRKSTS